MQIRNDYSGLFNRLNTSKSSDAMTNMSWLKDYANIKSGSYSKLMKAYYAEGSKENAEPTKKSEVLDKIVKKDASVISEETKSYNKVSANADALQDSIAAVQKTDLSDPEKRVSAVKDFADSYNKLTESVSRVSDKFVASRTSGMENNTKVFEKALNEIGVTVGRDGRLNVNEETLKAAETGKVESLFAARGSFAYSTGVSAGMIRSNSNRAATANATYSNLGGYNVQSGSMFDDIM